MWGENHERGSALLLMPTAVLIVVVLGSIAVDSALVFTAQRQLADAAAAAANDAVTAGLAREGFYSCGNVALDPQAVEAMVATSLAARSADIVDEVASVVTQQDADGTPTVAVTVTGVADMLFAPAVPGGRGQRPVTATAVAVAAQQTSPTRGGAGCAESGS